MAHDRLHSKLFYIKADQSASEIEGFLASLRSDAIISVTSTTLDRQNKIAVNVTYKDSTPKVISTSPPDGMDAVIDSDVFIVFDEELSSLAVADLGTKLNLYEDGVLLDSTHNTSTLAVINEDHLIKISNLITAADKYYQVISLPALSFTSGRTFNHTHILSFRS